MISTAIQRGNMVNVYNEKNNMLFSQPGELAGFTSSSVSVKRGNMIFVYNERGNVTASHSVH